MNQNGVSVCQCYEDSLTVARQLEMGESELASNCLEKGVMTTKAKENYVWGPSRGA